MTGPWYSHEVVVVLPAVSVAEPVRVLSFTSFGGVRYLDGRDHPSRKFMEKQVRRTYRVVESRITTTGRTGEGCRWWLVRSTVVCQWVIPRPKERDRVLLARFNRRWLESQDPALVAAIQRCAKFAGLELDPTEVNDLLTRVLSRSGG